MAEMPIVESAEGPADLGTGEENQEAGRFAEAAALYAERAARGTTRKAGMRDGGIALPAEARRWARFVGAALTTFNMRPRRMEPLCDLAARGGEYDEPRIFRTGAGDDPACRRQFPSRTTSTAGLRKSSPSPPTMSATPCPVAWPGRLQLARLEQDLPSTSAISRAGIWASIAGCGRGHAELCHVLGFAAQPVFAP